MKSLRINETEQVKWGAILAYLLIIINALYGLLLTPFIISRLGQAEYGVYKTISAFTASLMVLDLGLGGTVMRYIAKFKAEKEEDKVPNFIAMCFIQAGIIIAVLCVVMTGLYFSLDSIYHNGLSQSELTKAKQLYVFLCLGMFVHIIENVINGVITGNNHFVFGNCIKIIRLIARIILIIIMLSIVSDSLVIVIIDLGISIISVLIEFLYIRFKLKTKIRYDHWEKSLFFDSFKYTILMFFTSIAAQVNSNLDNVVIGAVINTAAVTVYSMGLLIFSMFEQLSTAISGVLLPTITRLIASDDEKQTQTQNYIVKVGRAQFALLGAAFVGFAVIGRQFVSVWLGNGYEDVYPIALILMAPSMFELCVNGCLSVLRAKNKLGFRTVILLATTVLNAVITIIGTYLWNYYAAAIGTAVSFALGSIIIMNIYYYRKLGLQMISMYKRIFSRIWICIILSGIACWIASAFISKPILSFVCGFITFILVYIISMIMFGLNHEEKRALHIDKIIGGKK